MTSKKRIGEMLLDAGVIDETQLRAALGHQRQWGMRLGQALVELKLATEEDVVRALSVKYGFEIARTDALDRTAQAQALRLFPREFVIRNNVLPMAADTATVTVAMSDPTNLSVVDEIRFRTGRRVKVCIGGDREVADAVRRSYPHDEGGVETIALDLEADAAVAGETVLDPFGGGSTDALDTPFGGIPDPIAGRDRGAAALAASSPLDLEDVEPVELTPLEEEPEEPVLASDLASPLGEGVRVDPTLASAPGVPDARPERSAASPALTAQESAILDSLERVAGGAEPQPEIVKPERAMAAVIRLLMRKGIVTEEELLAELRRK